MIEISVSHEGTNTRREISHEFTRIGTNFLDRITGLPQIFQTLIAQRDLVSFVFSVSSALKASSRRRDLPSTTVAQPLQLRFKLAKREKQLTTDYTDFAEKYRCYKYFPLTPWNRYSFPSHHALRSFTIAVIIGSHFPRLLSFLLVMAAIVSFSRIYLSKHYLSDVLAGGLLGVFVATSTQRLIYVSEFL